jgi:hypothetical protein
MLAYGAEDHDLHAQTMGKGHRPSALFLHDTYLGFSSHLGFHGYVCIMQIPPAITYVKILEGFAGS